MLLFCFERNLRFFYYASKAWIKGIIVSSTLNMLPLHSLVRSWSWSNSTCQDPVWTHRLLRALDSELRVQLRLDRIIIKWLTLAGLNILYLCGFIWDWFTNGFVWGWFRKGLDPDFDFKKLVFVGEAASAPRGQHRFSPVNCQQCPEAIIGGSFQFVSYKFAKRLGFVRQIRGLSRDEFVTSSRCPCG